jgi:hypothetical protein
MIERYRAEPRDRPLRPAGMSNLRRPTRSWLIISALVMVAGCSGAGGPAATGGPSTAPSPAASGGPSATLPADAIDHPTGATHVILRYEEGGGFINPSFLLAQIPTFTLYGDGTIVFRNPALEAPPAEGSIAKMNPARTAKLSEEQVQALLKYALAEGGLGAARLKYDNNMVADASTATFTIDAGGVRKQVQVYALGMDVQGLADGVARAQFAKLAQRLTDFDNGGTIPTDVYAPKAYRGVLLENGGVGVPGQKPWPWTDLAPADFTVDADPNGIQFPHHVLTSAQIDLLGVKAYEGGLQNVALTDPGKGKSYTLSVRPLLPDEQA